jgi:hypothetical protein
MTDPDPLLAFVDRFVPRDLPNAPGRYTVLRRQAIRELRELVAAQRKGQRLADADWLSMRADAETGERMLALLDVAAALREGA